MARDKVMVICGSEKKASLGVDQVIDHKVEDVKVVLKREFLKGVDIIYKSVGGNMFYMFECLGNL
jgi:NADPH-dependent curcumin reductase CurA